MASKQWKQEPLVVLVIDAVWKFALLSNKGWVTDPQ